MPSLNKTIQAVEIEIRSILNQLSLTETTSDEFLTLSERLTSLVRRKKQLEKCAAEVQKVIDDVHGELKSDNYFERKNSERVSQPLNQPATVFGVYESVNCKSQPETETLESTEDNHSLEENHSTAVSTRTSSDTDNFDGNTRSALEYMIQYGKKNRKIPVHLNFFYAVNYSLWPNVQNSDVKPLGQVAKTLWNQWQESDATTALQSYPMPLTVIDGIIHSSTFKKYSIFILDTCQRLILTNFNPVKRGKYWFKSVLFYDSQSRSFAGISPISNAKRNQSFCFTCFKFGSDHECQQCCPHCLREGSQFPCHKKSCNSAPFICAGCNAFCQTKECYDIHQTVCL